MRFNLLTLSVWAVYAGSAYSYTPASTEKTDCLAADGLANLWEWEATGHGQASCSLAGGKPAVRKEWSTLSHSERKAYTDAVNCLQTKPSKSSPSFAPGARTRYDDFVALHISKTLVIHSTANFLSWHRLFTWNYEQALRKECGYKGTQPYWNWGKSAFDPVNSPMFDGSAYSMSGNGVYEAHNCSKVLSNGVNCIPPGQGGGCVKTGPFKNWVVNLGPVSPTLAEPEVVIVPFLTYNPRCLKRDISVWTSSNWTRDIDSYNLITQNTNITGFQLVMQGNNFVNGFYGVHAAGHYTIGGDPGGDFFASPGDPAFFLHHAQIDRTWWIWQNQDLKKRERAIGGTITLGNQPPSRNGTLKDLLDMGVTGVSGEIGDFMSTVKGDLCYIYE